MRTKGLSLLQRQILQLALGHREKYGDIATLFQAEILAALYGFPSDKTSRGGHRKSDRQAISRATGRLMRRGFLEQWVSQHAGGPACYSLTPDGMELANQLRLIDSHCATLLTGTR